MKKFITVLKKIGKGLLIILSIVGALFLITKLRKAVVGKVKKGEKTSFREVPGSSDKIELIKNNGEVEIVSLPDKIKFNDVVAAGITEGGEIKVEVIHAKKSRKNVGNNVVDNNAFDFIGSGIHPDDGG